MSVTTAISKKNCIGVEITLTLYRLVDEVSGNSANSSFYYHESIYREIESLDFSVL